MSNFLYIRILFIMNQFQYSTQFLKREQGFFCDIEKPRILEKYVGNVDNVDKKVDGFLWET